MQNVRKWLASIGMSEHADLFAANRIDSAVLRDLTDHDLEKLGLVLGDRRKILRAIRELGEAIKSPRSPAMTESPLHKSAERRQLSVMFIDLVGSTKLSVELDPEDLGQIIGVFQRACATATGEFGGSIAKYIGDGALAYFGYPEAHEDDAERAVRAGLALVDAITVMEPPLTVRLQVRVGIATGLTVVGELIGEGSAQERVAVGKSLNLASRVQAAAPPNSVVVAELTRRLAGAAFDYEDLGLHELKGIAGATRLWRVIGESRARGRIRSPRCQGTDVLRRPRRRDWPAAAPLGLCAGRRWPDRTSLGAGGIRKVAHYTGVPRASWQLHDYLPAVFRIAVSCWQPTTSFHQAARMGCRNREDRQRGRKARQGGRPSGGVNRKQG